MDYIYLFIVSCISATLFPMGSEALFGYYISTNSLDNIFLLLSATVGNTLGACVNYFLGLKGFEYLKHKNFLNEKLYNKSLSSFQKYGIYSLLFSWVPIIGDPITFVAGILKINFYIFLSLVLVGKLCRYVAIWILLI